MDQSSKNSTTRTELQMARSMCWHCQSEAHGEYLCGRCVKVQPLSPDLDYFTCLGLPRLLTIDPDGLEAKFYELSRMFHPDFYQDKSETERTISLGNSALLNAAYRTLKDPIRRAEYLLQLEAGSAKDIRTQPPADLFEEILELQDDLEAFRSASSKPDASGLAGLRTKLEAERAALERRQHEMESRIVELFREWDRLQADGYGNAMDGERKKEGVLNEMRELLSNRTYVRNIVNDLVETTG